MVDWALLTGFLNFGRSVAEIIKASSKDSKEKNLLPKENEDNHLVTLPPSYQQELGQRHRYLRENYLQLNVREMADFYGYEKVSELEKYERGDDEFPTNSMKRLMEFFFINPKYLQEGDKRIFRVVEPYDDTGEKLIKVGFKPYFLCNPEKYYLYCYTVFYKCDEGYYRMIASDRVGSFASSGGGKANITNVINLMMKNGLRSHDGQVWVVDQQTWESLKTKTLYKKRFSFTVDFECEKIYDQWFIEESRTIY